MVNHNSVFILLAAALCSGLAGCQDARPHVVLILLDDVGYDDVGAFGAHDIQTPNIDRLAAEGMRLTRFYTHPVCSPSRAALLTGNYPQRFNIRRSLGLTNSNRGIPSDAMTLAELFKSQGYKTAHIGKWHLSNSKEQFLPINRGFDDLVIAFKSPLAYSTSYRDPRITKYTGRSTEIVEHADRHLTEVLTDYALEFIEQHRSEGPLFLNLWFRAAHQPLESPPDWAARYPRQVCGPGEQRRRTDRTHLRGHRRT